MALLPQEGTQGLAFAVEAASMAEAVTAADVGKFG